MFIVLRGPDDYRRAIRKQELIAGFRKKYPAAEVRVFDAASDEVADALAIFFASSSLFAAKKMGIVENLEEAGKAVATVLKSIVGREDDVVLVPLRKKAEGFDFLEKKGATVELFDYPEGAAWKQFVAREAKQAGIALDAGAAALLADYYAKNTWGLVTELQKLAGLGKKTITEKDLAVSELELALNYWAVMNGLKSGNPGARLASLEELLRENEPAGKIFNMISAMWPERVASFAAYDVAIKTGKLEYEEALLDLALI